MLHVAPEFGPLKSGAAGVPCCVVFGAMLDDEDHLESWLAEDPDETKWHDKFLAACDAEDEAGRRSPMSGSASRTKITLPMIHRHLPEQYKPQIVDLYRQMKNETAASHNSLIWEGLKRIVPADVLAHAKELAQKDIMKPPPSQSPKRVLSPPPTAQDGPPPQSPRRTSTPPTVPRPAPDARAALAELLPLRLSAMGLDGAAELKTENARLETENAQLKTELARLRGQVRLHVLLLTRWPVPGEDAG